jgi:hypothetical protein
MSGDLPARPAPAPPSARRRVAAAFAAGLLLLGLAASAAGLARGRLVRALADGPPPADSFLLPAPAAARFLSARFTEAAADFIWTRILVYYGERHVARREPRHLHDYLDAMVGLDPYFRTPYTWGGYAVPFASHTGAPTPEAMAFAVRLLRLGLARFPDDPELHGILGYDLYYELPRWVHDPETVLRARVEGAEHIRRQAALGGGPDWIGLSAASALEDLNLSDLAARHLEESAWASADPEIRRQILIRLARLRADFDVEAVRRGTEALFGAARERMPYVSPGFFLLLQPPLDAARMDQGLPPRPWIEDRPVPARSVREGAVAR